MQVNVECPSCGHTTRVAAAAASMKLQCQKCGATMLARAAGEPVRRSPAVSHRDPVGPAALVDPADVRVHPESRTSPILVAHQNEGRRDVLNLSLSDARRRTARTVCLAMTGFAFLGSVISVLLAFRMNSLEIDQALPQAIVVGTAATLVLSAIGNFIVSGIYFFCGLKMTGDSYFPVVLALIIAALHALPVLLFIVVVGVYHRILFELSTLIFASGLTAASLMLLALAATILCSVRILQVRR